MPQVIKLITGVYQIVGSFTESFNAVPWPKSYTSALSFFSSIVSFDFFGQPIFACQASGDNYMKRFMWHTLSVLFIVLVIAAMLLHAEMDKKSIGRRAKLWNILLPFLFIVYPSISKTVIRMLRCRNIDGASYLLSDFSVRCDQDEYSRYYGLAVFFTILYPIGIPGLFTYVLARNRHKLPPDWWPQGMDEEEDKAFTAHRNIRGNEWAERATWREEVWNPRMAYCAKMDTRFGFLFNAYTGQFWWFESVMSAYKLAMTTLIIFVASDGPGSTELRILFSMFMATCLMAVVAFLQPFKDADVLSVETMSNLELLFVLFAALYLALVPFALVTVFSDAAPTRGTLFEFCKIFSSSVTEGPPALLPSCPAR
eukprot:g6337.t1